MHTHFAVVNNTVAAFVHEFDGVFNGQNMVFAMRIGIIDQGCQGGRFAAACWAGHEHKPFGIQRQSVEDRRKPGVWYSENVVRDWWENRPPRIVFHPLISTLARTPPRVENA